MSGCWPAGKVSEVELRLIGVVGLAMLMGLEVLEEEDGDWMAIGRRWTTSGEQRAMKMERDGEVGEVVAIAAVMEPKLWLEWRLKYTGRETGEGGGGGGGV